MELTKLMAELTTLTPNGMVSTSISMLGKWLNVQVQVFDYKSGKNLVTVVNNGNEQKAMEQIEQLRKMLNN